MLPVRIQKLHPDAVIPKLQTPGSAAVDLHSIHDVALAPGERMVVSTGLAIGLPQGYVAQICPRSGLAAKNGITVLNAPGLCDSDYRLGYGVVLANLGTERVELPAGSRIAQLMFTKHETPDFIEVDELETTERVGGFGSTGL